MFKVAPPVGCRMSFFCCDATFVRLHKNARLLCIIGVWQDAESNNRNELSEARYGLRLVYAWFNCVFSRSFL